MPRIKITRCIIISTIVSTVAFLLVTVWMDQSFSKRKMTSLPNFNGNEQDIATLLFKSQSSITMSSKTTITKLEEEIAHSSPNQGLINEEIKSQTIPSHSPAKIFNAHQLEAFWASFQKAKPWFMKGGSVRPSPGDHRFQSLPLWPDEEPDSDRIANQLMFIPRDYQKRKLRPDFKLKKIFLHFSSNERTNMGLPLGRTKFLMDKCPVDTCEIVGDVDQMESSDAIFFKNSVKIPSYERPPGQIWILFLLESPLNTQSFYNLNHIINWTATYRHDSDIVAPYEKYFKLPERKKSAEKSRKKRVSIRMTAQDEEKEKKDSQNGISLDTMKAKNRGRETLDSISSPSGDDLLRNDSPKKEKKRKEKQTKEIEADEDEVDNGEAKVAWFVSNCGAKNSRLDYAKQLSKFITVDIYGSCGDKKCPRSQAKECFDILSSQYKYYLAFENSNCVDYITEKYFVNGLANDVIPIVMGAPKIDYLRASPDHSFIHVDDFESPEQLATFLHQLASDEKQYDSYLAWKSNKHDLEAIMDTKGEFINTYFWCRLCAMLHSPRAESESHSYPDIQAWWNPQGTCTSSRWT